MKTTLVVLAAGMGSRFGGIKQLEPITKDNKIILDLSIHDAIKAGFSKIIFIIREDIKEEVKAIIGNRISKKVEVDYIIQDLSELPIGRIKPFGTAHALYCCREKIKEPFAVINADDYYGINAFEKIQKHLANPANTDWCMLAYPLKETLSKNGTVNRGVCSISNNYLHAINETRNIDNSGTYLENNLKIQLSDNALVSMNLWGFTPDIFPLLETEYNTFLCYNKILFDEFSIPDFVNTCLRDNSARVKIYPAKDKWYGITYREDLQEVKYAINNLIENNYYEGI